MFWVTLRAAVPASSSKARIVTPVLKAEAVLSSSSATVTSHLSQPLLLQWKLPAHTEGETQQQKTHTQEREAFYLQNTAVCYLHNRSAVRNNYTNTKVSLKLKILKIFIFSPDSFTPSLFLSHLEKNKNGKENSWNPRG